MNCPSCGQLIYSRQRKTCGSCGVELPPECRLSDDEIAALKAEQQAIADRRAVAKEQEEEERKKQQAASAASAAALHPPFMM